MKKRLVLVAILVLVLTLFILPMPVSAATWYVDPSGTDDVSHGAGTGTNAFKTIDYAINDSRVNNGDTITVADGTYDESANGNVDVDKELTIRSQNGYSNCTVTGSLSDHIFNVTASNVTINGFSIYYATDTARAGIYLGSNSGCTISNNRCGWDASHKNYYGIFLSSSSNNTISGNTCSSNDNSGIWVFDSSNNNTVSGNTCNSNSVNGIYFFTSSSNNTVSGNTCNSNSANGIYLKSDCNYNTICGNICNSNTTGYGIILMTSSNSNTIYLNNFSGNWDNVYSLNLTNTWSSPTTLCYFYSGSYKNYLGNYYSDRGGSEGTGGIGTQPYVTDGDNDQYPLWNTLGNYTVQAWYLNSNDTMYEANTGKAPGSVTLSASGGSNIWISDYTASTDVAFSSGTWTGQVVFSTVPTNLYTFTVAIGYSTNGSDFTASGANATLTGNGTAKVFTYTTNSAQVSVPLGKYLALKITNNNDTPYNVTTGGAWSYTSNPDTGAPEYPVPELPVVIMIGMGLVMLGGYVWRQRVKRSSSGAVW